MVNYSTLPMSSVPIQQTNSVCAAVLACCMLGIGAVLAVSPSTTSLHTSVATRPVVSQVAAVSLPRQQLRGQTALNVVRRGPVENAIPQSAPSASTGAILGGFAMGAVASIAAIAINAFQRTKRAVTPSDSLLAYQNTEAQWSMAAATAFIGTKAPDFEATAVYDEEFIELKLSQYRGKKYVVLFFYPLDFTFVCPTEITAFSDRVAEFNAIDTQVIGVSVDSQFSHLAWVQTPRNQGGLGEITYPLVADLKKEIAEAYGVLTDGGVALRGLFIIDKEGVIQHATINNLAFGRSVDETLRVLQAVQHVQANPDEVCPAGWKKGDKTMKPDPEGSKEYFAAI